MTIEEWRNVADKLHAFDFTLAAVDLLTVTVSEAKKVLKRDDD